MNSRIYPKELYEQAFQEYKLKLSYCPNCFHNNLQMKDGYFTLFNDYKCNNCLIIFNKEKALNRNSIRYKKINEILNEEKNN